MFIIVIQRLFIEAVIDIFYFPLWWYTGGVLFAARKMIRYIHIGNEYLAPALWLKNLFVPMFGQNDFQGKLISFFMRFVQLIVRSGMLAVWIVFVFCLGIAWLAWPVIVVYSLIHTLLSV